MLIRLLKRVVLALGLIVVVALGALAAIGVPKPPAITKEGLGRVGWGPMFANWSEARAHRGSSSLVTWVPGGQGMLGWAQGGPTTGVRIHLVDDAGSEFALVPGIPWNAAGFHLDDDRPYLVLSWDRDGTERDHLFMWDPARGEVVRLTTGDAIHSFAAFEPDGPRIAYLKRPGNGDGSVLRVMVPGEPDTDRPIAEIGYARRVSDWSPSGDAFLIEAAIDNQANRLVQLDAATGERVPLLAADADSVIHRSSQYDRRGGGIYYTSSRGSEFLHLRRLDFATGEERTLTSDLPWDVTSVEQSADGRVLLLGVNEDGEQRYYLYAPETGERRGVDLFDDGIVGMRLHPSGAELIVNHTDANGVIRGHVYDHASERLTRWVGPEPKPTRVPGWRRVRYPTFDSVAGTPRAIPAFVYPGVGEGPRPVIVDIHGGPHSQARVSMGHARFQKMGITYIQPNVRGSAGYGTSFMAMDNGRKRGDAVKDIGALLDWIATQPDMDSDRVMLRGGSYGGFMVYASLVDYGDRVRCAKAYVGVTHPVTFLENLAGPLMGGGRPEWGDESDPDMRAYLDSLAPLTNADRIRTPLMISHGVNDRRVPVAESRQMVSTLRGNGIPVVYLEAADEGHGFRKPWNTAYDGMAEMQMIGECLLD